MRQNYTASASAVKANPQDDDTPDPDDAPEPEPGEIDPPDDDDTTEYPLEPVEPPAPDDLRPLSDAFELPPIAGGQDPDPWIGGTLDAILKGRERWIEEPSAADWAAVRASGREVTATGGVD